MFAVETLAILRGATLEFRLGSGGAAEQFAEKV